jgi:hypothetical protein
MGQIGTGGFDFLQLHKLEQSPAHRSGTMESTPSTNGLRFVSKGKFASLFELSLSTINRRINDGTLSAIQPGGPGTKWLIDLQRFMPASDRSPGGDKNSAANSPAAAIGAPTVIRSDSNDSASAGQGAHSVNNETAKQAESARLPGRRPKWLNTNEFLN